MPVYDYLCEDCGPFTEMRPMSDYELPHDCPQCGREAPRAFLTAPRLAGLSRRKPGRLTYRGKNGSKSFPTARPWMISH